MNFKLNTISAVLGSALLITAISGCTSNDDTQNNKAIAKPYIKKTGIKTKESQGLLIADNEKSSVLLAGNFESISLRQLSAQQFLLASIDKSQDNVVIFELEKNGQTWQLTELTRISPPQAQPDAVCLFKNDNNATVSAFVPDVRGLISETIVYDLASKQAKN